MCFIFADTAFLLGVADLQYNVHNVFFIIPFTKKTEMQNTGLNSRTTTAQMALAICVRYAKWPSSVHLCLKCKRNYDKQYSTHSFISDYFHELVLRLLGQNMEREGK